MRQEKCLVPLEVVKIVVIALYAAIYLSKYLLHEKNNTFDSLQFFFNLVACYLDSMSNVSIFQSFSTVSIFAGNLIEIP